MKTLTLLVAAAASARRDLGIDLGRQVTDWSSELCAAPSPPKKMKTEYPRLHLYDAPEATWEMPGEGTALITYRVTSREKREEEENGVRKMKHSIGLEIIDIDPKVKGKGKKKSEDSAGEDGVMDFGSLLGWCRELARGDGAARLAGIRAGRPKSIPVRGSEEAAQAAAQITLLRRARKRRADVFADPRYRHQAWPAGAKPKSIPGDGHGIAMGHVLNDDGQRRERLAKLLKVNLSDLVTEYRELRLRDENGVFVPSSAGLANPALHAAAYDPPGAGGRAQRFALLRTMLMQKKGRMMTPEEPGRAALM
jgi:hypothetical protein